MHKNIHIYQLVEKSVACNSQPIANIEYLLFDIYIL